MSDYIAKFTFEENPINATFTLENEVGANASYKLHNDPPIIIDADYNNSINKPLINGVELQGDKSLDELGIQAKGKYLTEHQDISHLATKEEVQKGLESKQPKGEYLTEHQDISGKQDKLIAGNNITIEGNVISATGGTGGGSTVDAYTKAETDELLNTKQAVGDYALKSELPDTSNLATKEELDTKQDVFSSSNPLELTSKTYSNMNKLKYEDGTVTITGDYYSRWFVDQSSIGYDNVYNLRVGLYLYKLGATSSTSSNNCITVKRDGLLNYISYPFKFKAGETIYFPLNYILGYFGEDDIFNSIVMGFEGLKISSTSKRYYVTISDSPNGNKWVDTVEKFPIRLLYGASIKPIDNKLTPSFLGYSLYCDSLEVGSNLTTTFYYKTSAENAQTKVTKTLTLTQDMVDALSKIDIAIGTVWTGYGTTTSYAQAPITDGDGNVLFNTDSGSYTANLLQLKYDNETLKVVDGKLTADVDALKNNSEVSQALAIGQGATASVNGAIAIGNNAKAEAYGAIQLGEGENVFPASLKVNDYTLLKDNGTIPFERLANINTPTNGQVLAYDADEITLYWKDSIIPQLTSVDVAQVKTATQAQDRENVYTNWMGEFSDIIVTLNLSKQELLDRMCDLYVSISRFKTNKNVTYEVDEETRHYRNIAKFSVMNDFRQKTDRRLYCWRFVVDSGYPEEDPRRWAYFYVKEDCENDVQKLESLNIGLWSGYAGAPVGYGTCFNAIAWTYPFEAKQYLMDYAEDYIEYPFERCEEYDISEFANVSDKGTYPDYNISDYVTKMECRKYTKDGQNYFMWCADWDDSSAEIYNMTDDNDNPLPNAIPKHIDKLHYVWNVFDLPSAFEFVEKRPDLNYKRVDDFDMLLEALQELTFKGKFIDDDGRPPYWNCYWFDYPVMPVLLKDCEVRKHESDATNRWVKLETLVNNGETYKLNDNIPIELKLPYNTYYLWMRFCSLQKRCAYGDYSNWLDESGVSTPDPMYPYQKHNLNEGVKSYAILHKRAFGRPRQSYRIGAFGKICEYVQFNVCTPMDATSGSKSKSTAIQKRLYITTSAKTGLRN